VALPAIDLTPIVVENASDVAPAGLRAGQSLTLRGDGALGPDFATVDATLNIEGGSIGSRIEVASSTVTISDGGATSLTAFQGSEINGEISGGDLGGLTLATGSVVDVTGGAVVSALVESGSTLNVFGGSVRGGTVRDNSVRVFAGGEFNLYVTEAFIDGALIDDLSPGETRTISGTPNGFSFPPVTLSGMLTDGSEFFYTLNPFSLAAGGDVFEPGSTVTVTLVSPTVLGDVNRDGVVDFLDISPFIVALSAASPFIPEADCNQDGEVNFFDISSFIEILSDG